MPQKNTRQARQARKNRKTRRREKRTATTATTAPSEEHHHFYSKMVFDGENMMTETQKDDEPVQRRLYTMKQLEREIPIGAELLRNENIHTVPPALQYPIPRELGFRTVLPNPADLGLLPPRVTSSDIDGNTRILRAIRNHNHNHTHTRSRSRSRSRSRRNLGSNGPFPRDPENLKLVVEDPYTRVPPRDLFHLPA
jgi:hypothetical protein